MFKRKKNDASESNKESGGGFLSRKCPPSIIAADFKLLGNIVSDGAVDIDGCVDGNVRAVDVIIRKNGRVAGDVIATRVKVYGEVDGLVKACDVELFEDSMVKGTIIHEKLAIEDGAQVDGQFKRQDKVVLDSEAEADHLDVLRRFNLVD